MSSGEPSRLVQFVGLDAMAKGFSDAAGYVKGQLKTDLAVTDRRAVELPLDGQKVKVATVSYKNGARAKTTASVVDPAAFAEWVRANHPEALVQAIAEWFTAEVLATAIARGVAVDGNGEEIPGVEVSAGSPGDPYIAVEHVKTPEAKAALMTAVFADNAAGLRSLLAIEPPEVTE